MLDNRYFSRYNEDVPNICSAKEDAMEFRFICSTIFEVAVAAFIIYGLFFEERFAEAERKALAFIKRRLADMFSTRSYHSDRV